MSQGNTTKASECSTPAILNMSNDSGPSEMGVGQPMVVGRKLLPPIVPGDKPVFVCEKQYAAILRLRERRLRIKEARERRLLEAKKHRPRGPNGRFVPFKCDQEGPNGGSNGCQQVTTVDGEAQSSTPQGFYWFVFTTNEGWESSTPAGIGFYYPFITSNGGENVGDVASGSEVPSSNAPSGFFWPVILASGCEENISNHSGYFCWPVVATNEYGEDMGESAYGSEVLMCPYGGEVPISNPAADFCWPVVATNDDEENIGEVAYNSILNLESPDPPVVATNDDEENIGEVAYNNILNLESPDPTDLLRIMMGNRYSKDEVSEQFQNLAQLQAPGFTTLLTIMNNAGYDPAADPGFYDVNKVMTRLEGWW